MAHTEGRGPSRPCQRRRQMNPVVEGWRGLAALLVMLAHFGPAAGLQNVLVLTAFTGVDLFFVLSGFVFAPILLGQPQHWGAYALRRAFRILPAYWLAVMVYAVLLWQQSGTSGPWASHLAFLHLSSPQTAFALNPAFWSLVPEVEFYLMLPLLALWVRGSSVRFLWLLAGALALRLGISQFADRESANLAFVAMHHLPGMLVEFLLGSLVWWLRTQQILPERTTLLWVGLVAWLGLAIAFGHFGDAGFDAWLGPGQVSLLAALTAALMLAGSQHLSLGDGAFNRAALLAGALSYAVYLFHNAALKLVSEIWAAVVLTFLVAIVVHVGLEAPARRLGRALAARITPAR